jgi:hypothetical protein
MMKNIDLILWISGVLITVITAYIGIAYTLKQNKKIEITFWKNSCTSLFDAVINNMDEIEITYKGKRIGHNLILLKGTFVNTGSIDIDSQIVYKPLSMNLPENYCWEAVKIVDSSHGLNVQVNKQDKIIEFAFDLLKVGEYFTFDCLVEYYDPMLSVNSLNPDLPGRFLKEVTFNHRITGLKKIEREYVVSKPLSIRFVIFTLLTFLGLVLISVLFIINPNYVIVHQVKIDSTLVYVTVSPVDNSSIRLHKYRGGKIMDLPLNQFNKNETNNLVILKRNNTGAIVFYGIAILFCLFSVVGIVATQVRKRRIYNKIKPVINSTDHYIQQDNILLDLGRHQLER